MIDRTEVVADDALLTTLDGSLTSVDAYLVRLLLAWRTDVDADPIPEMAA